MPSTAVLLSQAFNGLALGSLLALVSSGITIILGTLGVLFIVATVQGDPKEANGIDGALKTIQDQPFGPVALIAIGVGLVCYAIYLVFRARYDQMD